MLHMLAERMSDENDLSDMLYAAMRISQQFARAVCGKCGVVFPDGVELEIRREVTFESRRPDLVIDGAGKQLIVEVKLDDTNYHLDEYSGLAAHVALLTNHALAPAYLEKTEQLGWTLLHWSPLLDWLDSNTHIYGSERDAIGAFIAYARAVTGNERMRQMKFDPESLSSLTTFRKVVAEIARDTNVLNCTCVLYDRNAGSSYGPDWFGIRVQITTNSGGQGWPYFYLYFPSVSDVWCGIELDPEDDQTLIDFIHKRDSRPLGITCDYSDRKYLRYTAFEKPEGFAIFSNNKFEAQRDQLRDFYERVMTWLATQMTALDSDL